MLAVYNVLERYMYSGGENASRSKAPVCSRSSVPHHRKEALQVCCQVYVSSFELLLGMNDKVELLRTKF